MFTIKVFEHQTIKVGEKLTFYRGSEGNEGTLEEKYINALWKMYDEKKRPFFTPSRGGIKFCEWVGVIKVLDLTLEILPKADKKENFKDKEEQNKWQSILIDMLHVCRSLDTPTVSDASLKLKSNSILDLYIERFINEVTYLLHAGLIKKYRREEVNHTALKGKLLLQKHITKNVVHKELFFISKTTYDRDHLLNQILYKAIKLLPLICTNQYLISKCYQIQLNFPDVKDVAVDNSTFEKLVYDRKSESYKSAIQIAKLLLLSYRPDVSSGASHSIAILFDMNKLWEEYIYRMLLKANDGSLTIHNQKSTKFWNHQFTNRYLKPDIVIERSIDSTQKEYVVIDTKWKNIANDSKNVKMDDLRQMFAYHHYFDAVRCYLLYPGSEYSQDGNFVNQSYFDKINLGDKTCGIIISEAWAREDQKWYLNRGGIGKRILTSLKLLD
jgi:5-methylcytosine-specific restriction enzyme subunit McrC